VKLFVFVISHSLLISIIVLEDSFLSTPNKKMCCKLHQILFNPTKGKGKGARRKKDKKARRKVERGARR
jgi:hypothetical protein